MKKAVLALILFVVLGAGGLFLFADSNVSQTPEKVIETAKEVVVSPAPKVNIKSPSEFESFELPYHTFQSFNNCGPATLSMMLNFYGNGVDQETLANEMRPYRNPQGNNDDKSIFSNEFVHYARENGVEAIHRPNGDMELLKTLIANGFPVVVRSWLHPGEDIGHFRIVKGYDDRAGVIIQDDSYDGRNIRWSYSDFMGMWQPFNYGYILLYPKDREEVVKEILGDEFEEDRAYENALERAVGELESQPNSPYPGFNASVAEYYLGNYQSSINYFERVENSLPSRMLWYQLEPIEAYKNLGNQERVFSLTERILNNQNRGFSELYQIRGEMYERLGQQELAQAEFDKVTFYNKNFYKVNKISG